MKRLTAAYSESLSILSRLYKENRRINPAFGGFVASPIVFAACTLIHLPVAACFINRLTADLRRHPKGVFPIVPTWSERRRLANLEQDANDGLLGENLNRQRSRG